MIEHSKIDFLEDGNSSVALVDRMVNDHALKVANAARASYDNKKQEFESKDQKLTKFLWEHEHTSPFRHSYYTFELTMPIFVARQVMKYQVGSGFRSYEVNGEEVTVEAFDHMYDIDKGCSWNEVSGRYVQTSDQFYIPKELRSNPGHGNKQSSGEYSNPLCSSDEGWLPGSGVIRIMKHHCESSLKKYGDLINNGVAKEIARMILPQNMYTKVCWTISLQAIIWFLHQRLKPDAQYEIRLLAEGIYSLISDDLTRLGLEKENL
jgi:thymidylate synthase (FAD)